MTERKEARQKLEGSAWWEAVGERYLESLGWEKKSDLGLREEAGLQREPWEASPHVGWLHVQLLRTALRQL